MPFLRDVVLRLWTAVEKVDAPLHATPKLCYFMYTGGDDSGLCCLVWILIAVVECCVVPAHASTS
jgi:hypothetical protein